MDVAIVGAGGVCGRQLLMQLITERVVPSSARLQLVTHRGGSSESELWGIRADVLDAFSEIAPTLEVAFNPEEVDADIVVMMAGATISGDPGAPVDRAALGRTNGSIFRQYAEGLANHPRHPLVIVQSNPVELGVQIFTEYLDPHRVLGAAGFSDTLRFSQEIGTDLKVPRSSVRSLVLGQHGDHLVPCWSQVHVRGVGEQQLRDYIAHVRAGRDLADLPEEIRQGKAQMLDLVRSGHIKEALDFVNGLPTDVRFAVRPFFTHFTAGRTTEVATANAVSWLVSLLMYSVPMVVSAQVRLTDEWEGIEGVTGAPVLLSPNGWSHVMPVQLHDDEVALLHRAVAAAAPVA